MGCCQSNVEIDDLITTSLDNMNIHDPRLTKTEEGFGDLSLDSHHSEKYEPILETSKTRLGDSVMSYQRAKSTSLHRNDIETAFLQSDGVIRKLTLITHNIFTQP